MKKMKRLVIVILIVLLSFALIQNGRMYGLKAWANSLGKDWVKIVDDDVYLHIKDEWVNSKDIKVFGKGVFKPKYLDYNGAKIYLGDSSFVDVIKFLGLIGVIDNSKIKG